MNDILNILMIFNEYFQVKAIDKDKFNKVYQDVMKKLDNLENDYLPQAQLDPNRVRAIEQAYHILLD